MGMLRRIDRNQPWKRGPNELKPLYVYDFVYVNSNGTVRQNKLQYLEGLGQTLSLQNIQRNKYRINKENVLYFKESI